MRGRVRCGATSQKTQQALDATSALCDLVRAPAPAKNPTHLWQHLTLNHFKLNLDTNLEITLLIQTVTKRGNIFVS